MANRTFRAMMALGVGSMAAVLLASRPASSGISIPASQLDTAPTTAPSDAIAVFSGGCFWGVQAVFQHTKGVLSAVSGYAGGAQNTATYDQVSDGNTGHAESVRITYDPSQISYGQLLQIFFSVAHDPTQLNYQGPDHGTQYRSAIWYTTAEQKAVAEAYIAQLTKAQTFARPIVTQVAALDAFFPAEAYHQDYATLHPLQPYIVINDAPKVERLKKLFPALYRETPVLVNGGHARLKPKDPAAHYGGDA